MLALRKDQADWWRKSIPRSVSMDAVNTEARGRMRSLCWGKDITAESPPPEVAMSDSYGESNYFRDDSVTRKKCSFAITALCCLDKRHEFIESNHRSHQCSIRALKAFLFLR